MSTNGQNGWRTEPMYSFSEAAHLARVSTTTVRNWLWGFRERPPIFGAQRDLGPMVSFLQLIEIIVARRFRMAAKVPFERVLRTYKNAQNLFQLEYPFAHLRLEALGGHILHGLHEEPLGESALALSESPNDRG